MSSHDANGKLDQYWLARLQSLGKTQARYLWFLVVIGVFYLGLSVGVLHASSNLKVPLIDLEIEVAAVRDVGGMALSFLVLVVMGALRAYRHATERLGIDPVADQRGEAADTEPNFLDLAFYTTGKTPKVLRWAVYFKYPVFLLLILVEAGFLLFRLRGPGTVSRIVFFYLATFLWSVALIEVLGLWRRRFKNLRYV